MVNAVRLIQVANESTSLLREALYGGSKALIRAHLTGSNPVLTTSDWLLLYNEHRRIKEVEFSQVAEMVRRKLK